MLSNGWWDIHNGRLSRTGTNYAITKHSFYANGRALYGDWGRLGSLIVFEGLQSCRQFTVENNVSYKLDGFYYLKQDEVLNIDNPHFFLTKRKEIISAFFDFRHNIEQFSRLLKKKHRNDINSFIEAVNSDKSVKSLQKKAAFTPSCFQYFVNKRSDLLSNETAEQGSMLSSPIYTGGCIKTVKFCEDTYVIYCDGTNMSKLTINKINEKTNSLEKTNIYQYEIKDERIFQIDVAEYADYFVILIRFLSSIESLKLDKTEEKLIIESISANNSMDQFISCKLDSSWPRTYASSFSDKIHIYDTKKKQNVWCKDITNSVIDHWNEIQSTNISQTWLFTDRSSSYLYDARTNPFSPAVELFNNRTRSLSVNESFYHATNIFNSNNYYVFSTFNAVLLDIRSPFSVVSQWTVPNMSPVSYSSVKYLPTLNEFNITVGYQMKAKHSIFQQNKKNTKSTCLGSKPHNSYDTIMSLGIATVFNERSNMLSVLTLDNKGNVLGNQYQLNDDSSDCNSTLPKPVTNQYHCISTKRFKQSIPTDEPMIDIERLAPYENWKNFPMETKKINTELVFRLLGIDNIKKDKSSN